MTALRDTAKAKINLTLEVIGRRPDFYHELKSLVAFAELGDAVELELQHDLDLLVGGPFAGALSGDNLIPTAAEAAKRARSSSGSSDAKNKPGQRPQEAGVV